MLANGLRKIFPRPRQNIPPERETPLPPPPTRIGAHRSLGLTCAIAKGFDTFLIVDKRTTTISNLVALQCLKACVFNFSPPKCCRVFHASVLESILMRMCIIRRLRYSVHIFPCWFADILGYVVYSIYIFYINKYVAFQKHPGTQFDVCEIHTYAKYIQTCCADT